MSKRLKRLKALIKLGSYHDAIHWIEKHATSGLKLGSLSVNDLNILLKCACNLENKPALKVLFPYLYNHHVEEFNDLIITESNHQVSEKPIKLSNPKSIIYNLDGYIEPNDSYDFSQYTLGASLSIDNEIPIGYVINLPPGTIKASVVTVYGGSEAKDKAEDISLPGRLNAFEKALLTLGFVVIKLNLVDLLKLQVFQDEMPEILSIQILESIDKFHHIIVNSPEQLHPTLSVLKGKRTCLYGASWGGLTTIQYAKRFEQKFDRYISFAGALAGGMAEYLNPSFEADKISAKTLLIHNYNDNNVNLKVLLKWLKMLGTEQQNSLVNILILEKGNKVKPKTLNTGHGYPEYNTKAFNLLTDTVSRFVLDEVESFPELSAWRISRYRILSKKNDMRASGQARFIEEIFRRYELKGEVPLRQEQSGLFAIFYFMATEDSNSVKNYFFNLRLDTTKLISGLRLNLNQFIVYLEEKFNIQFNCDSDLLISEKLIEVYGCALFRNLRDSDLEVKGRRFLPLPFSILLGNTDLQAQLYDRYKADQHFQAQKAKAEAKLELVIRQYLMKTKSVKSRLDELELIEMAGDRMLLFTDYERKVLSNYGNMQHIISDQQKRLILS